MIPTNRTLIFFGALLFTLSQAQAQDLPVFSNSDQFSAAQVGQQERKLSTFMMLVALSGLGTSTELSAPHTLFIPTNDAMDQMPQEQYLYLIYPNNRKALIDFVNFHYLPTVMSVTDLGREEEVLTKNGKTLPVTQSDAGNSPRFGGATIIASDIEANDGIIHVVDRVLTPNNGWSFTDR
ncbi:fasciclin domain-containing protein [Maribacter sp. 2307ULW6-5]|uniref:fasciclin domain-containing protein n=1 Tax=Maribacter sp. 2307ULW6-5 TaxID=3386275 RepID=UPI0039BC8162